MKKQTLNRIDRIILENARLFEQLLAELKQLEKEQKQPALVRVSQ